jgi:predicted ATP-grasp superfamily ATP-dependent carboligase
MNRFLENLKTEAEANPLLAMGIATGLLTAINMLAKTRIDAKKAVDHAKEIDRRIKKLEKS